jgi:type I restriction enzyme, S subunit
MKIAKLDVPVLSSWMEHNGRRLDSGPYLSGAMEAKVLLDRLPAEKQPLHKVTKEGLTGIYHAGRASRTYVDDPAYGVPFLRGYPETSQHRCASIKQPPGGNEKQGSYMERACSA